VTRCPRAIASRLSVGATGSIGIRSRGSGSVSGHGLGLGRREEESGQGDGQGKTLHSRFLVRRGARFYPRQEIFRGPRSQANENIATCPAGGLSSLAWGEPATVIARGKRPTVVADSKGYLHLAYQGYPDLSHVPEIMYARSQDGGATWSEPRKYPTLRVYPRSPRSPSTAPASSSWSGATPLRARTSPISTSRARKTGAAPGVRPSTSPIRPGYRVNPAWPSIPTTAYISVVWCDTSEGEKSLTYSIPVPRRRGPGADPSTSADPGLIQRPYRGGRAQ